MKNLKPVFWTAVGMVVGAAGVVAATQTGQIVRPDPTATTGRMHVTTAGSALTNDAYFVKDIKTGACWLALKWDARSISMAAAPKEACD